MKTIFKFFSFVLALLVMQSVYANNRPMVLLISIDGFSPSYVFNKEKYGLKIPNLTAIYQQGTYATGVVGINPTLTYPSHVTLITGANPVSHGIDNNELFDPLYKHHDAWYWYTQDIKVPTLWSAASKAGLSTANVEWPVSVGAPVNYNIVQYWRDGTHEDEKLVKLLSTPGLIEEAEKAIGHRYPLQDWSVEDDIKKTDFILYILEKKQPQFFTVYFASVDANAHHFGPSSLQARTAIEAVDASIGKLWKSLQKTSGNNYILAIVSDHGLSSIHSQIRLNAAFKQAKLLDSNDKHHWRAYAWTAEGEAGIYFSATAASIS
jgi:predicted AlkP superfamily pyrophosphatase or phosphodiesterase